MSRLPHEILLDDIKIVQNMAAGRKSEEPPRKKIGEDSWD